ncbi:hypothetical protein [Enterovirga aerilata]|uniref:Uncharacterized protein n=1 Tax=Enterovirga aerilata TaxID=2730920 RepID=A0A849I9Y5_9HYPH|nr:hypothetical protein [Enterovirga sp. DB1703]NNM74208.1 hypothetical protein [Enterovirga sp. DB1703]
MSYHAYDDAPCWIGDLQLLDPDFDDWGDVFPLTPLRELPWSPGRPLLS